MRRWLKALALGTAVGLGGAILDLSPLGIPFEQRVGLSWLFHLRGPVTPPPDVAVIAIDRQTGARLGLPASPLDWERAIHGELVEALVRRGASIIVFDIFFARAKSEESDLAFAAALRNAGRAVLVEKLTGRLQPISDRQGVHRGMVWVEERVQPLPSLAQASQGLGPFPLPKVDSTVREFWTFKTSAANAPTMPAVALQLRALEDYAALRDMLEQAGAKGLDSLPRGSAEIGDAEQLRQVMRGLRKAYDDHPKLVADLARRIGDGSRDAGVTGGLLRALNGLYGGPPHRHLNFYGPAGTILNIPYQAVITGSDPNLPEGALDLRGKTVFVGFSDLFDPGQPDAFYTVFTSPEGISLSGVEIAATAYANLLTGRALEPLGDWQALAALVTFGLATGLLVYLLPATAGVPAALALAGLYALGAQWAFNTRDLWFPLATPLLAQLPLALLLGLLGQYLLERRRGRRISAAINYYLPEDVVRGLTDERMDPGKINKVVFSACLATDMAGFSSIAERLPPGELATFLNDYFECLAAPLKQHGVRVTEFRADAIMCAWTSEQASAEPRRQALLAALEAVQAIRTFQRQRDMPPTRLRIGLEAGWVYVGHAGGGGRFVYSIVGDSANTASRVEGLNKHLGTEILATGAVVEGFENLVARYLGDFHFVGKAEAIPIYEVLARNETATEDQVLLCARFGEALSAYHQGLWTEAARRFEALLATFPGDGPARFYLDRCQRQIPDPETQEDPRVVRMDVK